MAKAVSARPSKAVDDEPEMLEQAASTDTSITALDDFESSARLISKPKPAPKARPVEAPAPAALPSPRPPMELIVVPSRPRTDEPLPAAIEPPRFASRNWHAEAWERERERELRAGERRPGIARRRFS